MSWRVLVCVIITASLLAACGSSRLDANGPQIRQINVNGVSLRYEQQGEADTVVLVHGAVADFRGWDATRDAVAAHYHVLAASNRYFGTGPWPDAGATFSMQSHADDLAAFIRALNTTPVNLVGWSYGADIALVIAVQHPDLVKSVFAYEPSLTTFVSDPADRKAISSDQQLAFGPAFAISQHGDQEAALRPFVDGVNGLPGTYDQLPAHVQTVLSENARTIPLQLNAPPPPAITCANLGRISVPVTIARGTLTRPFFRVAADTAHRCIPGSRLVLIQDGRHLAPVELPGEFNAQLLAFLAQQR